MTENFEKRMSDLEKVNELNNLDYSKRENFWTALDVLDEIVNSE